MSMSGLWNTEKCSGTNRGSYRGYGYSRADGKEEYIENLRDMMQNAPDDQTRQSIQRMIQQMEQG